MARRPENLPEKHLSGNRRLQGKEGRPKAQVLEALKRNRGDVFISPLARSGNRN